MSVTGDGAAEDPSVLIETAENAISALRGTLKLLFQFDPDGLMSFSDLVSRVSHALTTIKSRLPVNAGRVSGTETVPTWRKDPGRLGGCALEIRALNREVGRLRRLIQSHHPPDDDLGPVKDTIEQLLLQLSPKLHEIIQRLPLYTHGNITNASTTALPPESIRKTFNKRVVKSKRQTMAEFLRRPFRRTINRTAAQTYPAVPGEDLRNISLLELRKDHLTSITNPETSIVPQYVELQTNQPTCLRGTRTALLVDIEDWITSSVSPDITWLRGMAGTGKTAISNTVAQMCLERRLVTAIFTFTPASHSWRDLLASLVTQVSEQFLGLQNYAADKLRMYSDDFLPYSQEQLLTTLLGPRRIPLSRPGFKVSTMVLIVDALENCRLHGQINELLQLLSSIGPHLGFQLRLFVTSRPETFVQQVFGLLDANTYRQVALEDIDAGTVEHDLRLYFKHRLRDLFNTMTVEAEEGYVAVLVRRSMPLFLVADIMSSHVLNRATGHLDTLKLISKSWSPLMPYFEATYWPILRRVFVVPHDAQAELLPLFPSPRDILGSLLVLVKPLSVIQLGKLLTVQPQEILWTLNTLRALMFVPSLEDEPIKPPHASFCEYAMTLTRNGIDSIQEKGSHHTVLTLGCLKRLEERRSLELVLVPFSSTQPGQRISSKESVQYAVSLDFVYACCFWPYHFVRSVSVCDREVDTFLRRHLLQWLELLRWLGGLENVIPELETRLAPPCVGSVSVSYLAVTNAVVLLREYQNVIESQPSLGNRKALRVALDHVDDGRDFWRGQIGYSNGGEMNKQRDSGTSDETETETPELPDQPRSLEPRLEMSTAQFVDTTTRERHLGEDEELHQTATSTTKLVSSPESPYLKSPSCVHGTMLDHESAFSDAIYWLLRDEEILAIAQAALLDPSLGTHEFENHCFHLVSQLAKDIDAEAIAQGGVGRSQELGSPEDFDQLVSDIMHELIANTGQAQDRTEGDQFSQSRNGAGLLSNPHSPNSSEETLIKVLPFDMPDTHTEDTSQVAEDRKTNRGGLGDEGASNLLPKMQEFNSSSHDPHHAADIPKRSQSYLRFKSDILEYAHTPHRDRLLDALGDDVYSESGERLDDIGRGSIVHEISWVPKEYLSSSASEKLSFTDSMKGLVEDLMGETWNWWPLSPRKRALHTGYHRWKWQAPCGASRFIDIPKACSQGVRDMIDLTPDIVDSGAVTSKAIHQAVSSSASGHTSSQLPSSTSGGSSTQPSGLSGSKAVGNQSSASQKHSGSTQQTTSSSISFAASGLQPQSQTRHVYLCVKTTSEYHLNALRCDILRRDVDFFHELKEKYLNVRGSTRNLLSMWRYDHCQFVRFRKYGVNLYEPTRVDFPLDNDKLYDFAPRPMHSRPPDGPISEGEFRDHFYKSCYPCHSWHRHQLQRWLFNQQETSAVQSLPKRIEELELRDGRREEFWGIFAKERRGFAWVLGYAILCNMPGTIFFFLWLFRWKHAADLQDASIPVMLSLSLTIGFVSLLYESRERRL